MTTTRPAPDEKIFSMNQANIYQPSLGKFFSICGVEGSQLLILTNMGCYLVNCGDKIDVIKKISGVVCEEVDLSNMLSVKSIRAGDRIFFRCFSLASFPLGTKYLCYDIKEQHLFQVGGLKDTNNLLAIRKGDEDKDTMVATACGKSDYNNDVKVINIMDSGENPSFIPLLLWNIRSLAIASLNGRKHLLVCENEQASLYEENEHEKNTFKRTMSIEANASGSDAYTLLEKGKNVVLVPQPDKNNNSVSMCALTLNEAGQLTKKTVNFSDLRPFDLCSFAVLDNRKYLAISCKNMVAICNRKLDIVLHEPVFSGKTKTDIHEIATLSDGRIVIIREFGKKMRILHVPTPSQVTKALIDVGIFGIKPINQIIGGYAAGFSLPDEKDVQRLTISSSS